MRGGNLTVSVTVKWSHFMKLLLVGAFFFSGRFAFAQTPDSCTNHLVWTDDQVRANTVTAINRKERVQQLEILASAGCVGTVEEQIRKLGATVKFIDRRLGYIDSLIPTDRLLDALAVGGMDAVAVWYAPSVTKDPKPLGPVTAFKLPIPQVATELHPEGPYFPTEESGLAALRRLYPKADGRGTRIAIVDSGIDLLHPALEQAVDATGNPVPKIVDLGNLSAPDIDDSWVNFGEMMHPANQRISFAGRTWIVPSDDPYQLGIFAKKLSLGDPYQPGGPVEVDIRVGVLWDSAKGLVWVDTDGDGDFTNNRPLADYAKKQDIEWFGTRTADEDNRIPFGVKIDGERNAVYLQISRGGHATFIASTAAANRLTGGLFDGAAPMAQLVDFVAEGGLMSAIVLAAQRPDVDVVNWSGVIALPTIPEARPFVERVLKVYKKPLVCLCSAMGTISVEDYQSVEMLRRNTGAPQPLVESMTAGIQSFDGTINEIVAPSAALTAQSRSYPHTYKGADGRRYFSPNYAESPAPDGYEIGSNASPTISYVSGVIASVVSLAKQRNIRYDATRIADAVFLSSKLVPGFPAAVQSHGLIDASGMWHQLETMSQVDDPNSAELTSFEVSRGKDVARTRVYGYTEEFEKSGDEPIDRELWVTRHGGDSGARRYRLLLRGDIGGFSLRETIADLPKDVPVHIAFRVTPKPDQHVAFLQLVEDKSGVAMHEIPLEIKSPHDVLETIAAGVNRLTTRIPPRRLLRHKIAVDPRAQAIRVGIEIPFDGKPGFGPELAGPHFQMTAFTPLTSEPNAGPSKPPDATIDSQHHIGPMRRLEGIIDANARGLWTLAWDNRGTPEYENPYDEPAPDEPLVATMTMSNYAVSLQKFGNEKVKVRNLLADVTGRVEFFAGRLVNQTLSGVGTHGYAIERFRVEPDTAVLRLELKADSKDFPAHVFALSCEGKFAWNTCDVEKQVALENGRAVVTINEPQEGEWRIVVFPDEDKRPVAYELKQVALRSVEKPTDYIHFTHLATRMATVPTETLHADSANLLVYGGFRISPVAGQKDGTLIALSPLTQSAF